MPVTFIGSTPGTSYPQRKRDTTLFLRYAYPPHKRIRGADDGPGSRNPHNEWTAGSIVGGEETGMQPFQAYVYDDDIRFGGTKAFSYTIRGQTLDSSGVAVPGATVELWLSYPNWGGANEPRLMGTTVSDGSGNYGFAVPNNTTQYFVVAYTSAKGGVTVRNLTGA